MRIIPVLALLVLSLFMACETEPSIQVTPTGYEYQLVRNTGGEKVVPGQKVSFHQEVYVNDSLYSSTWDQPNPVEAILPEADQVPSPFPPDYEIIQMMAKGDSAIIYQKLDTISNLPPSFAATDVVSYRISIIEVMSKADVEAEKAAEQAKQQEVMARLPEVEGKVAGLVSGYAAGNLDLQKTETGLQYIIHEEGTGATPTKGQEVSVQYYGALTDGKMFDSSFTRGTPIDFPLGMGYVIPGWDEGIGLLKEGSKATFFIPSALGYGEAGSPPAIPANADLIFYVELEEVK